MPSDHITDLVDDYCHGLLDDNEAARVERHCAACPRCHQALDEARRRRQLLEEHRPAPREASEELIAMTMKHVQSHGRKRRFLRRGYVLGSLGALAAGVLLLFLLQAYYENLSPTPYDLRLLSQAQFLAGSDASLRVQLASRQAGVAIAGIPVELGLVQRSTGKAIDLGTIQTDALGTGQPKFRLPEWAEGDFDLHVTARVSGQAPETIIRQVAIRRSWQVMLTSDKPVYQPGQAIRIRSLSLRRPDLKPVAGEPTVFTVIDPKGNVIFKESTKTSAYGIASTDCLLANEILEGSYAISCRVGNTESRLTVTVQRYVLPKFGLTVNLDRPYYAPGDQVTVALNADYFFGKPVANGEVQMEIQGAEVGLPLLHRAVAKTDDSGKTTFTFPLPKNLVGRPQDGGDARLSVQVAVSDSAGQVQGKATSLLVTNRPLRFEVIPEGGSLIPNIANTIYVFARYADGRPAKATVEAPNAIKVSTNDLGLASFEVTPGGEGLQGVYTVRDAQGLAVSMAVNLPAVTGGAEFHVRTDKAVYNGGESIKLQVLSSGSVEPVFVDVIKDGQTMLTQVVDLARGKGDLTLDLPPEVFGTLQLCAYRLGTDNVPVRKTRVLYVRPAGGLKLKATLDQAEYRPGGKAKVQLELRGQDNNPVPGAISLAAVDEAVFAVLQQRPGLEGTFYTLEKELLKPVYAIYPWAPDLTTSEPVPQRIQFEQALFARTTQAQVGMAAQLIQWGPHTLVGTTFPAKDQLVRQRQDEGREKVRLGWTVLAFSAILLLYLSLWVFVRPLWIVVLLHGIALVFLCGAAVTLFLLWGGPDGRFSPMGEAFFGRDSAAKSAEMAPMSMAGGMEPRKSEAPGSRGGAPQLRVREEFPETLLWRPEVITDDNGRATLDIDLADSITTWRLSASAVAADGRLGAVQSGLRVFQPFFVDVNLPVALTRGDEVSLPVVVYNYLDQPQTVDLTLADATWFERLGESVQKLDLKPREVRGISYRVRVKTVGRHKLEVTARAGTVADAIRKEVDVVPDGKRVEQVVNTTLAQPLSVDVAIPENAIEGSAKILVKLYPSGFSQLVEGLDSIFRMPSGCFEQTSSTTYPNVLALDYLKKTGKAVPEVEAKARQFVHLGYQRLLTFEVAGGGFDWFGRPPANRTLTAYGLMEFRDMARVHEVDPALIARTRVWLMRQRKADGAWEAEGHAMHEDPTRADRATARLATTAYIAWAVFEGDQTAGDSGPTREFLLKHPADSLTDPYLVALMANALYALDPDGKDARPYLARLDALKKSSEDGKWAYWQQAAQAQTPFYGSGRSGAVETTSLALLALLKQNTSPGLTKAALTWLIQQKDANGTWHSTQATVLALKALLAGTGKTGAETDRRFELVWNGQTQTLQHPANQGDVLKQIELTDVRPGAQRLQLREVTDTATTCQVTVRYHVPDQGVPDKEEPLLVQLNFDRATMTLDDTLTATAVVTNRLAVPAPMVLLDLPIPPGFALTGDDLDRLREAGTIARYQVMSRSVLVYLRNLEPGKPLRLAYRLKATMPVKVTVPPARAFEYYNPDRRGASAPSQVTVRDR